jgi:hypothetical protein
MSRDRRKTMNHWCFYDNVNRIMNMMEIPDASDKFKDEKFSELYNCGMFGYHGACDSVDTIRKIYHESPVNVLRWNTGAWHKIG